jgi:hypothetical protein
MQDGFTGEHKMQRTAWDMTFQSNTTDTAINFSITRYEKQVMEAWFHL